MTTADPKRVLSCIEAFEVELGELGNLASARCWKEIEIGEAIMHLGAARIVDFFGQPAALAAIDELRLSVAGWKDADKPGRLS